MLPQPKPLPTYASSVLKKKGDLRRSGTPKGFGTPKVVGKMKRKKEEESGDDSEVEELGEWSDLQSSDRNLRQRRTSFGTVVTVAAMERIENENLELHDKEARLKEKIRDLTSAAGVDQDAIVKLKAEVAKVKRCYTAVAPGKRKRKLRIISKNEVMCMFYCFSIDLSLANCLQYLREADIDPNCSKPGGWPLSFGTNYGLEAVKMRAVAQASNSRVMVQRLPPGLLPTSSQPISPSSVKPPKTKPLPASSPSMKSVTVSPLLTKPVLGSPLPKLVRKPGLLALPGVQALLRTPPRAVPKKKEELLGSPTVAGTSGSDGKDTEANDEKMVGSEEVKICEILICVRLFVILVTGSNCPFYSCRREAFRTLTM